MNKAIINDEVVIAYDVLKNSEIVENGKIKKTWRGQISTFGAAVTMGSLIPAVAFFSDQGGSSVKRQYIMDAILEILKRDHMRIMRPQSSRTPVSRYRSCVRRCRNLNHAPWIQAR